jgi:SAM-dependent methyltransferase
VKATLVALLACPRCGGALTLEGPVYAGAGVEVHAGVSGASDVGSAAGAVSAADAAEVIEGTLRCGVCAAGFPIAGGIPRFVPAENYARSFGLQWNRFRRTQLDSHSGVPVSRDRFLAATRLGPRGLEGALVLDVGCGAGRFAEVALSLGAHVCAVDYSSAVDACWRNLGPSERLHVVQADVYRLPLRPEQFDVVYCLGVLQHTPDVRGALAALPRVLKPGGRLVVDVYGWSVKWALHPRFLVRPLTSRLPEELLFRLVERLAPALLRVSRMLGRVPALGPVLRRLALVANYEGRYPLSEQQLVEWCILDTYDMLAPRHDHPQSVRTLRSWLEALPLADVEVEVAGHVVGRATKRAADSAMPAAASPTVTLAPAAT